MKAVKEVERKYYKYVETPFTQPILSSDGVIGGGDFAVFASSEWIDRDRYAYKAFAEDTSYAFTDSWDPYPQEAPCYIGWYNPNLLKMESLTIRNSTTDSQYNYWVRSGELQYSNDNINWFTEQAFTNTVSGKGAYWTINVDNPVFSRYKRLYITAAGSHNRPIIANIQFNNAIELLPVESTEADYDYYKDVNTYSVVKQNNIYKAIKSYEKGQYYGN